MVKRVIAFGLLLGLVVVSTAAQEKGKNRGSVNGTVEDQEGKPVAGVKVRAISRRTDEAIAEAITDGEGKFVLTDLPVGRYALIFYSSRHQQTNIPSVEIKAGQESRLERAVRLKPVKLYAVIEGAVFNSDGYLVPGARVSIERIPFQDEEVPKFKQDRRANTSGAFAFRLSAATALYRLTAELEGYKPQSITVEIGGAERRHVSLQLEPKE